MKEEANLFKALGEPTRLGIATLLAANGETCVCHLAAALGEADFKISRSLSVLKAAGIVEARREGTWMHYRLARGNGTMGASLRSLLRRLGQEPQGRRSLKRLSRACCQTAEG